MVIPLLLGEEVRPCLMATGMGMDMDLAIHVMDMDLAIHSTDMVIHIIVGTI
jgi:hypothetical protein